MLCYFVIDRVFAFQTAVASAPTDVQVCQHSTTTISIEWTAPNPLGHTTGYRVHYYTSVSDHELVYSTVPVFGGPLISSYMLTNLEEGGHYFISVEGMSDHFPSGQTLTFHFQLQSGPEAYTCEQLENSSGSLDMRKGCDEGNGGCGEGRDERYRRDWGDEGDGGGEEDDVSLSEGDGGAEEDDVSLSEGDGEGEEDDVSLSEGDGEGEEDDVSLSEGDGGAEEDDVSLSEGDGEGEEDDVSLSEGDGEGEEDDVSLSEGDGEGEEDDVLLSEGDGGAEEDDVLLSEGDGEGEGDDVLLSEGDGGAEEDDVLLSEGDGEGEEDESEGDGGAEEDDVLLNEGDGGAEEDKEEGGGGEGEGGEADRDGGEGSGGVQGNTSSTSEFTPDTSAGINIWTVTAGLLGLIIGSITGAVITGVVALCLCRKQKHNDILQ